MWCLFWGNGACNVGHVYMSTNTQKPQINARSHAEWHAHNVENWWDSDVLLFFRRPLSTPQVSTMWQEVFVFPYSLETAHWAHGMDLLLWKLMHLSTQLWDVSKYNRLIVTASAHPASPRTAVISPRQVELCLCVLFCWCVCVSVVVNQESLHGKKKKKSWWRGRKWICKQFLLFVLPLFLSLRHRVWQAEPAEVWLCASSPDAKKKEKGDNKTQLLNLLYLLDSCCCVCLFFFSRPGVWKMMRTLRRNEGMSIMCQYCYKIKYKEWHSVFAGSC